MTSQGIEKAFAEKLEISPSSWSMMKGPRVIGDRLARQIERHCSVAPGWLDEHHPELAVPDRAEEHFLELARAAWRRADARGRRELLRNMREVAKG